MPIDVTQYISYIEPFPTVNTGLDVAYTPQDPNEPPAWAILCACVGTPLVLMVIVVLALIWT
jgi:hypothetical protein